MLVLALRPPPRQSVCQFVQQVNDSDVLLNSEQALAEVVPSTSQSLVASKLHLFCIYISSRLDLRCI